MSGCQRCRSLFELVERLDRVQLILMGAPATPEELALHLERIAELRASLRVGKQWWET